MLTLRRTARPWTPITLRTSSVIDTVPISADEFEDIDDDGPTPGTNADAMVDEC